MNWYELNCGDPTLCDPIVQEVLKVYDEISHRGALSPGAAVFSRHESRGDLHCELILYFTPAAGYVASGVGAICSAQPASQGLSLIAGSSVTLHSAE